MNLKNAAAIGIIGTPDKADIEMLEEQFGKPVRIIERKNRTILIIGKGLFRKRIVFRRALPLELPTKG